MTTVNRELTRRKVKELSRKDLHWMKKQLAKELHARYELDKAWKADVAWAMAGMANVMAGVTWALACRETLRKSKGHTPAGGKRPQSGEMWLPREILIALRAEVKERGWCPLGVAEWQDVKRWLYVEGQRYIGDAKRAELEKSGNFGAVTFRIPFASEVCAVRFEDRENF